MSLVKSLFERRASNQTFDPGGGVPRSTTQEAVDYVSANGGGGGGGSGAPDDAQYLVSSSNGDLTNERVVGNGTGIAWDFSGIGTAVASLDFFGLQNLTDPGADRGLMWNAGTGGFDLFEATVGLGFSAGTLSITDTDVASIVNTTFSAGDILWHNGSTFQRLAAGLSGRWLRTNAGLGPFWDSLPAGNGMGDMLQSANLSDVDDPSIARTNLGVEIGSDVQPWDATLDSIASLGTIANRIAYTTGVDTWAETPLTSFARSILDDADEATFKATVNLEPGVDVQAYSANLDSWSGEVPSDYALLSDLASTANGDGASLIGIEDAGGYFTGMDAEAVLQEVGAAISAIGTPVQLKGTWDASSGSFPGAGAALAGWSYIVSVGGTVDGVAFTANDRILAITDNASTSTYASNWHKLDYTDQVLSVAGKTGAVTLDTDDITDMSANGRSLVTAANYAAMRALLDLEPGTDVQPQDATLSALAAFNSNGLLVQTAADTFVARTITGTANEIDVTNGNGGAGNPTLSLPSALTFTGKTVTGGTFAGIATSGTFNLGQAWTLSGDITPTQISANTDNWAPSGLSTAGVVRASTDASRNLTGLTGGSDGRVILLLNVGSNDLVLVDESGSSTAGNRFALNANVTLGADQSSMLYYDGTSSRWRVVGGTGSGGGLSNVVDDTTPQLGGNLDINGKAITAILTAGTSLANGDLCYMQSDGEMYLADADAASSSSGLLAICTESLTDGNSGTFVIGGVYTTSGLTTGSTYFVSTTAGDFTATAPNASGDIVRVVGYALSATQLLFMPSGAWVEIA